MTPELTIIAAMGRNREIGRGGDLAFHISADLRRFKALTMGGTLIMGRKTFESLPGGPLPGRRNIVLSRTAPLNPPAWGEMPPHTTLDYAPSLEAALAMANTAPLAGGTGGAIFIIGGGQVYAQALPLATRLELTLIDATLPDADTFFPEIPAEEWLLESASEEETDPRTALRYRFLTYHRR